MISSVVQSELIYVFYSYIYIYLYFRHSHRLLPTSRHHAVYHCSIYSLSTLEHVETLMCG